MVIVMTVLTAVIIPTLTAQQKHDSQSAAPPFLVTLLRDPFSPGGAAHCTHVNNPSCAKQSRPLPPCSPDIRRLLQPARSHCLVCVLDVVSFLLCPSVTLREEECEDWRLEEDQEETPVTESDSDGPEAADAVSDALSAEAAARYSGMWREPGDETECVGPGVTKEGVRGHQPF